jgi:curved DNA-binding protein CbpA
VEAFEALYASREEKSYYELLGVSEQVSADELKRTFKKIAGSLHIDKFMRFDLSEERLETLKKLFIVLNKAHQTLSDPAERREYDLGRQYAAQTSSHPSAGGEPSEASGGAAPTDLASLLRAEQLTREALTHIKQGNHELAQRKAESALQVNTEDPLTRAVLLYTQALELKLGGASAAVLNNSADQLEALTQEHEAREEPFYFLGMVRLNAGDLKRALVAFERAVKINPHYAEANSQLRFVQRQLSAPQKASATSKVGGLFGRRK